MVFARFTRSLRILAVVACSLVLSLAAVRDHLQADDSLGEEPVWRSMGPPGGDVFSLAAAPRDARRLFLGTADGHIFGSRDGGNSWTLLGRAGAADGVVMSLLVDPRDGQRLYAAAWTRSADAGGGSLALGAPGTSGGVYVSEDGGINWHATPLTGVAVRALAQAPSNPDILIAGAADGVYRSRDAARTWERISPAGHEEIRNLDSVAIDPLNSDVVYIGTYHLPWKTSDGGRTWREIHDGMIDDSDVMSIRVDRTNPKRIYASACSGIYRSDNAGLLWRKIQGIPYSARRTHVIAQHPTRPQMIFAATTEGLWSSPDGGASWRRLTPANWVITALAFDAENPRRIVMGTERLGVQVSDDGGATFRAANHGFHHRQILSLALDARGGAAPERVLAVLANSPEPLLATEDGGRTWAPLGPGLRLEAVKGLYSIGERWFAAMERGGLMRYDAEKSGWMRAGVLDASVPLPPRATDASRPAAKSARKQSDGSEDVPGKARGPRPLDLVVEDMAASRDASYAATAAGLLVSRDAGDTWSLVPVGPVVLPVRSVRVSRDGRNLWVVTLRGMSFSHDGGATWSWHDLPFEAGGALRLEIGAEKAVFATARHGLYISWDDGSTWKQAANGLPQGPVQAIAAAGRTVLASMQSRGLYVSPDDGRTWTRVAGTLAEGFFPVVATREGASVVLAASGSDGVFAVELGARRTARE